MTTKTTDLAEIHAQNVIAQVKSAIRDGSTSDDVVPLIADLNDMDPDRIADDVAGVFNHLEIAQDLREDPAYAYFVHEPDGPNAPNIWHGEDVTPLIDKENERALEYARRVVVTLRADMNRPRDMFPPCEVSE